MKKTWKHGNKFYFLVVFMIITCSAGAEWLENGEYVNNDPNTQAANPSMAFLGTTPYVAFHEIGSNAVPQLIVKYFTGEEWIQLGGSLNVDITQNASCIEINVCNQIPVVAWEESEKIYVKKYENGIWTSLGVPLNISMTVTNVESPTLTEISNNYYASWIERRIVSPGKYMNAVYVKYYNGNNWELLGTDCLNTIIAQNYDAGLPSIANCNNTPYVAWQELNAADSIYRIYVKRFNGAEWVPVGGCINNIYDNTAQCPRLGVLDTTLYITWAEFKDMVHFKGQIYVKHWNGGSWITDGDSLNIDTNHDAGWPSITMAGNPTKPYVAWRELNSATNKQSIYVKHYEGGNWIVDDSPINYDLSREAWVPRMATSEIIPFVCWYENAGSNDRVYVKNLAGPDFLASWLMPENCLQGDSTPFTITGPEKYYVLQSVKLIHNQTFDQVAATGFGGSSGKNKITGMFDFMNAVPGFYHLLVQCWGRAKTVSQAFLVMSPVSTPAAWEQTDMGFLPAEQISGTALGLWVGDLENENAQKVYAVNRSSKIYRYKMDGGVWSYLALPLGADLSAASALVMGDGNHDGTRELYAGEMSNAVKQFSGPGWLQEAVVVCPGMICRLAAGDGNNQGDLKLYAACSDGNVYQIKKATIWEANSIGSAIGAVNSVWVADGNNDDAFEVYAANSDTNIYQFKYNASSWFKTTVGNGSNEMLDVIAADGDNDGLLEVYGANADSTVYQFKWNVDHWVKTTVGTGDGKIHSLVFGDAENTGMPALYAACADGHIYQFRRSGGQWEKTDIGSTAGALYSLALGDGNNDNQLELYTAGQENHLCQFKYVTLPTPTTTATLESTPTASPTITATPFPGFKGRIISEDYIYAAPNPVRTPFANIVIFTKVPAEISGILYTTGSQEVLSFRRNYDAGKNIERIHVGNLANGVYLLLIKAKDPSGIEEKVIKKIAIVK